MIITNDTVTFALTEGIKIVEIPTYSRRQIALSTLSTQPKLSKLSLQVLSKPPHALARTLHNDAGCIGNTSNGSDTSTSTRHFLSHYLVFPSSKTEASGIGGDEGGKIGQVQERSFQKLAYTKRAFDADKWYARKHNGSF